MHHTFAYVHACTAPAETCALCVLQERRLHAQQLAEAKASAAGAARDERLQLLAAHEADLREEIDRAVAEENVKAHSREESKLTYLPTYLLTYLPTDLLTY